MKKKTRITIIVSVCIMIAAVGIYFLLHAFQTGSSSETIYVQKVSTVTGSSYTENRYSGVVESQETLDINQDSSKTIADVYVEAGQQVKKGDKLFSYDTTEASNSIAQKKLDIEAQNNEIEAQNNTIADYKTEIIPKNISNGFANQLFLSNVGHSKSGTSDGSFTSIVDGRSLKIAL